MSRVRIAAMQPYFLPYAGYFRLFLDVDAFVIADSFQYSRHGWVNRNRFYDETGRLRWLTVPLRRAPLQQRFGTSSSRRTWSARCGHRYGASRPA